MSVELWKSLFDWAAVVLVGLTFIAGAGALITGSILSVRQDQQLRQFNSDLTRAKSDLATQQERAATADARVAELEKEASGAKAAQQQVEIELATQKTRAADAERSLLELQEKLRYRGVSDEQRDAFLKATSGATKGEVEITALSGDPESIAYAESLRKLLIKGGWSCAPVKNTLIMGDNAIGLTLAFDSVKQLELDPRNPHFVLIPSDSPIFHGLAIKRGFDLAKIPIDRAVSASKAPSEKVVVIVGAKP